MPPGGYHPRQIVQIGAQIQKPGDRRRQVVDRAVDIVEAQIAGNDLAQKNRGRDTTHSARPQQICQGRAGTTSWARRCIERSHFSLSSQSWAIISSVPKPPVVS